MDLKHESILNIYKTFIFSLYMYFNAITKGALPVVSAFK